MLLPSCPLKYTLKATYLYIIMHKCVKLQGRPLKIGLAGGHIYEMYSLVRTSISSAKLRRVSYEAHATKKTEGILDRMGSEELAANLFRATQTEAKLKRESIYGEGKANQVHYDVGKKVRKTIQELGGTMPEKLPTPEHINESKKRLKKTGTSLPNKVKENLPF